jgi:hypothetical protein
MGRHEGNPLGSLHEILSRRRVVALRQPYMSIVPPMFFYEFDVRRSRVHANPKIALRSRVGC